MKKYFIGIVFFCCETGSAVTQEIPPVTEQQLENVVETGEVEDDTYLQLLEHLKKDPLNLNTADATALKDLILLTDWQIENLLAYRKLLGKLISLYELQAIPGWDISTIRKLLPFITIAETVSLPLSVKQRLRDGDHGFLFRISQATGESSVTKPLGSPQHILFRYRYNFKNNLQFGIVADKDAGEQFFKGAQRMGFDFYSAHFFARKIGNIQAIALGDYTVNMGQGLIHWQGLAFKKSGEAIHIKRQSAVLRPYNSAGEFYFHRGAALTFKKGRVEVTAFLSHRRLSANIVNDSLNDRVYISSILRSGYHRTANEAADRNKLTQLTTGTSIQYRKDRLQVGVNVVYYHFSLPMQKRNEPYNLYALNGKAWVNGSVDYSYTWKNIHLFGEGAIDKNFNRAFINGVLVSVDAKADIAVLHRVIARNYRAVYGNAFTESTEPANENGLYMGVSLRPLHGWRVEAYADLFKFAWLKYGVDAPSSGADYLIQLVYTPNKRIEISSRFRSAINSANPPGEVSPFAYPVNLPKQQWRTQTIFKLNSRTTLRQRLELVSYVKKDRWKETGYLFYIDVLHQFLKRPVKVVLRLQYYETGGYNSRIFAYENDVLFSNSIPSFFGNAMRYYLVINYKFSKSLTAWLRWAHTVPGIKNVMSATGEQAGKGEIKLQLYLLI